MFLGSTINILHLGDSLTAGSIGGGQSIDPITDRWCDKVYAQLQVLYPVFGVTWSQTVVSASGATSTAVLQTEREHWIDFHGDLVTIELGVNDGPASTTGAAAITALALWETNVSEAVAIFAANGVPKRNILIFGLPPQGNSGRMYGGIYDDTTHGGADADKLSLMRWHAWTQTVAGNLGCTHVPMYDVYDPGVGHYVPDQLPLDAGIYPDDATHDPSHYISEIDSTDTHPNAAGYAMWYDQVMRYMPTNLLAYRYPHCGSPHSLDK